MKRSEKGAGKKAKKRVKSGTEEETHSKAKKHTEEINGIEETKGESLEFEDEFEDVYGKGGAVKWSRERK